MSNGQALPAAPVTPVTPVTATESAVVSQRVSRSSVHIDLGFLQNRAIYHRIPTDDIPHAFLDPDKQPAPGTSLSDLLQQGHFRRAAETALKQLLEATPNEAETILQLLYTRLACLVLISHNELAAEEALPLTDFLGRSTPGVKDVLLLVPWDLRLLLVRLQSITAADGGRRGIMALYALAGEVRAQLLDARSNQDDAATELWSARLKDIGLRVSDTLVEVGELETATRHLDTLTDTDPNEIGYRRALLRVRVGDVAGALRSARDIDDDNQRDVLSALITTAEGDFAEAVEGWKALVSQRPEAELLGQNLAVCLLYIGRITEARDVLERLSQEKATAFTGLLFNLSTVYELCTERAVEQKNDLAQRMAGKLPVTGSGGWERSNVDFKL